MNFSKQILCGVLSLSMLVSVPAHAGIFGKMTFAALGAGITHYVHTKVTERKAAQFAQSNGFTLVRQAPAKPRLRDLVRNMWNDKMTIEEFTGEVKTRVQDRTAQCIAFAKNIALPFAKSKVEEARTWKQENAPIFKEQAKTYARSAFDMFKNYAHVALAQAKTSFAKATEQAKTRLEQYKQARTLAMNAVENNVVVEPVAETSVVTPVAIVENPATSTVEEVK